MEGDLGTRSSFALPRFVKHKQINQLRASLMAQFPERKDVIDGSLAAYSPGSTCS